jgi:hypothetical protein
VSLGAKVMLPNGSKVPQVKENISTTLPWHAVERRKNTKGGTMSEMRKKVVRNCTGLIRQIGRVDMYMLGPRQTRKVMELAIAGVLGYYARSTPMAWADCQSIQLKQYGCRCWRSVVRIRYVRRRAARRGLLTGGSWGGGARACIGRVP